MPAQSTPANTIASPSAVKPPAWWKLAACRRFDLRTFFPRRYDGPTAQRAKRICADLCPVRDLCLEEALLVERDAKSRRHGVFGGLLPAERHEEWRRRAGVSGRRRARSARASRWPLAQHPRKQRTPRPADNRSRGVRTNCLEFSVQQDIPPPSVAHNTPRSVGLFAVFGGRADIAVDATEVAR